LLLAVVELCKICDVQLQ